MDNLKTNKKKVISHTQFAKWFTCPRSFFLDYIKKLRKFEDNLHMCFGTAIHDTIQLYLTTLFQKSEPLAEKIHMFKYFNWDFKRELEKKKIKYTPEEFEEFLQDGKSILIEFKKVTNRTKYFPIEKYVLINIEHELRMGVQNNLDLIAYLDVVLKEKETGKIKIFDIKTSTNAWTSYQKEDFVKQSQLLLYKAFYSKKYNVPLSMIDIEFLILRRKLYDNCNFPQSRLQSFKPSSNQKDVIQVINEFSIFVDSCFTEDGSYIEDKYYQKNPGKNKKNCKYCQHKQTEHCDAKPEPVEL